MLEKETGDRNLAWNNPKLHDFFVPEEARWDSLRHLKGFVKVISLDELAKNGYILNVNRYVLLPKVTIDATAEVAKLRTLKGQLAEAEKKFVVGKVLAISKESLATVPNAQRV